MRHRNRVKTLGRKVGPKKALLRGLAIHLIDKEKIITTIAKAKVLRPQIEKMITKARTEKENILTIQRELLSTLDNRSAVLKLINDIAQRFSKRSGGYTRIIKLQRRQGDGAFMAQIEFVEDAQKVIKKQPESNVVKLKSIKKANVIAKKK